MTKVEAESDGEEVGGEAGERQQQQREQEGETEAQQPEQQRMSYPGDPGSQAVMEDTDSLGYRVHHQPFGQHR